MRAWPRAALRFAVARRRLLLGVLLGVLAVSLLVVLPAYSASQPRFVTRYAALEQRYESWSGSTHAEVACRDCHVPPDRLARSVHGLRMLGEFYASAVLPGREPDLFGKPGNAACERCHRDIRQASPSGDLKIPHRAHVEVLKLDCVQCHSYLVHEATPEGTNKPRMVTCMGCHDGRRAKSECSACHQYKDAPENHRDASWLAEHADRQDEVDCESCHGWTPDWCRECHTRRPASHAGKWRSLHPEAVERNRNCEACHRGEFCVRCHGEVPSLNAEDAPDYVGLPGS